MRRLAFALRVIRISLWLQVKLLYGEGVIMSLVVPPLTHTLVMVLLIRQLDRPDLAPYAVIGPAFLGSWNVVINFAGTAVAAERWAGTLELTFSTPAGAWLVILGRVLFTAVLSLFTVVESVIFARLFGVELAIDQPLLFALVLAVSLGSLAAVGLVTASTFVLANSIRLFTNLLVFPLLIFSGAAFPVEILPEIIRPISEVISLKWSTEMLRASAGAGEANVTLGLTMVGILTVAYLAVARGVFRVVEQRVRADGSLTSEE